MFLVYYCYIFLWETLLCAFLFLILLCPAAFSYEAGVVVNARFVDVFASYTSCALIMMKAGLVR
jgi:hypothetical protein